MTRDEHGKIVKELLGFVSAEHQADASMLLTQLSDDYDKTLADNETLTNSNKELTNRNEKLREVNADLFLKVGTTTKTKETNTNKGGKEETTETPTFDSLFNEKGELK